VNEFGMSSFPQNFNPTPPPPALPPRGGSASSTPFLIFLLILSCVGVGALLAWGLREHGERTRLSERNIEVEKSYVVVLAKRSDLASFLTDQRTHLFHLSGQEEASGKAATVAWQEETHTGLLVADKLDPLPEHTTYIIWHLNKERKPDSCGEFKSDPTGTLYDFRCLDPSEGTGGFLISIEPDKAAKLPSHIVYETR
jgi:hypothetical protein